MRIRITAFLVGLLAAFSATGVYAQLRARIEPMAITSQIVRLDITDADLAGAVDIDFHYRLTTDNAEAIAMGAQHRGVVVRMECLPRGTCLNAIATLRDNSLIVQDGGWPEGALPLPRPRKP